MLQATEYPFTDGKVKKPRSKYELTKGQTSRWKCGEDVELYYQNLSKKTLELNSSDSQREISTSSAALNNLTDLVDREVQTDIDGVHYKVTSKHLQG